MPRPAIALLVRVLILAFRVDRVDVCAKETDVLYKCICLICSACVKIGLKANCFGGSIKVNEDGEYVMGQKSATFNGSDHPTANGNSQTVKDAKANLKSGDYKTVSKNANVNRGQRKFTIS